MTAKWCILSKYASIMYDLAKKSTNQVHQLKMRYEFSVHSWKELRALVQIWIQHSIVSHSGESLSNFTFDIPEGWCNFLCENSVFFLLGILIRGKRTRPCLQVEKCAFSRIIMASRAGRCAALSFCQWSLFYGQLFQQFSKTIQNNMKRQIWCQKLDKACILPGNSSAQDFRKLNQTRWIGWNNLLLPVHLAANPQALFLSTFISASVNKHWVTLPLPHTPVCRFFGIFLSRCENIENENPVKSGIFYIVKDHLSSLPVR